MVLVRETVMDDWPALRDIRLAALRDAPDAFASTYAEQAAFEEADWRQRIARGGTFLAFVPEVDASEPAGLAGGYEPGTRNGRADLHVRPAPSARPRCRRGAHRRGARLGPREERDLGTPVGDRDEQVARLLYERCGFSPTGERQPVPSNPDLDRSRHDPLPVTAR